MSEEKNNTEQSTAKRVLDPGKILGVAVLLIVSIVIAVLVTFSLTVKRYSKSENALSYAVRQLDLAIGENAYFEPDTEAMTAAAVKAYVSGTGDPYTVYYTDEEFRRLTEQNGGTYSGIGISVRLTAFEYLESMIEVMEVYSVQKDSPALKAGICVGDRITAVRKNGEEMVVSSETFSAVTDRIKETDGNPVFLEILRGKIDAITTLEIELVPQVFTHYSVNYRISDTAPDVGIVTISLFDLTTPRQLKEAIDTLEKKGIVNYVIDLRDNGGGDLNSVIACASYFLEYDDTILSVEDKNKNTVVYKVEKKNYKGEYAACDVVYEDIGRFRSHRYSVLVNGQTASAAELLTAVFRDYKLGTVIGEKTFGKGSMQTLFSLESYGLAGGLRITTRLYFPPCGVGYNGIGITPDIIVPMTAKFPENETEDNQLLCAIGALKS